MTRTALIAEDDEFFRIALKTILSDEFDFENFIETDNLDDALAGLGETSPVVLACFDLGMPGVDSPANLATVRELFPDTFVVVVSSSSRRSDILMALEAGVHGYVPKGLGVSDLTEALKTVMKGGIFTPSIIADRNMVQDEAQENPVLNETRTLDGSSLTKRQWDVLELLAQAKSNKEIARTLDLGEGTVKIHVAALFRNLGVHNRSAAALAGMKLIQSGQNGAN